MRKSQIDKENHTDGEIHCNGQMTIDVLREERCHYVRGEVCEHMSTASFA